MARKARFSWKRKSEASAFLPENFSGSGTLGNEEDVGVVT
jgi:hypothetical protein